MEIPFRLGLAAILTLLLAPAHAQTVANLNLETWATRTTAVPTGVEAPANWQTFDDVVSTFAGLPLPASSTTVTKSADAHGGSFAARLETKSFALLGANVPGAMALGTRVINFGSLYGGIPYSSRPTQMQFYYKLSGAGAVTDNAGVSVSLSRTTNGVSTDIVLVHQTLAPAAAYTLATVPLNYTSNTTPDSLRIEFYSGSAQTLSPGTVLLIDDISFGMPTASRVEVLDVPISASPNPSADGRFLLHSSEPSLLTAPFTVTDITGRVILQSSVASPATSRLIDLGAQAAGLYTLRLETDRGLVIRKLVVQ